MLLLMSMFWQCDWNAPKFCFQRKHDSTITHGFFVVVFVVVVIIVVSGGDGSGDEYIFPWKKKCQSLWSFYFQAPGIFNVKHSKGDDENIRFSTSGFFAVHLFFVLFGNWVAEWLISDCQIIIFFSTLNTRVLGHLDYSKSGGSSVISREICWTDCNVASKCQTERWEAIIHSFRR